MSLDVSLEAAAVIARASSGIFVRRCGVVEEISLAEWQDMCPWHTPTVLDSVTVTQEVFAANITHNLGAMAKAAGIYAAVWRPDENGLSKASQLVELLQRGLSTMTASPGHFQAFDSPNGFGTYRDFVPWLEIYLQACRDHPDADVRVSR